MPETETLVLSEDVLVFPASQLEADERARSGADTDDYIVTRPHTRHGSTVVDRDGAALIESFRTARTIVDAVIDFSRARERDPQQVLEEAFPLIDRLMVANLLAPNGSDQTRRIEPTLATGDAFGAWTVEQAVHVLADTEVYRVRDQGGVLAALKLARPGYESALRAMMDHEAAILTYVAGTAAPRLIEAGAHDGRPFLLLEWCDGAPAPAVAQRLQRETDRAGAAQLLELCVAVLEAYAGLHAKGVVQGDIHPNNLLASEDGTVRVIDFGRARLLGEAGPLGSPQRGGAPFYVDPQYAQAALDGRPPPPPDPASEQYSIAVLLREMIVGRPYIDFSLDPKILWRQIVEEAPAPFSRHGAAPWRDVEQALGRALAKDPGRRFGSIAEFAQRLSRAEPDGRSAAEASATPTAFLDEVLAGLALEGRCYRAHADPAAPCSVNNGGAGIAYALYRIASLREDPALLALADLWITRAERRADDDRAFYGGNLDMTPDNVGRTSLFHTSLGVACVETLVAMAQGDGARGAAAAQRFVARARLASYGLDLTLGRAGVLLGCVAQLPALDMAPVGANAAIVELGDEIDAQLRRELAALRSIDGNAKTLNLGIAHGWGGVLFALLRWREARRRHGGDTMVEMWLRALAAKGEAAGSGLRWRWLGGDPDAPRFMSGWCNGAAGMVHLYTLAERAFGDAAFGEVARQAASNAWEEPVAGGDLCCGAAGRAYAMLDLYRHASDKIWLERGRDLAAQAATQIARWSLRRDSLYRGEVGVALLITDLERPELSCMPLFDREP